MSNLLASARRLGACSLTATAGAVLFATAAALGADKTFHSELHSFRLVNVARGLNRPWSLAFLPDGRMLVTERRGRLHLVTDGRSQRQPVDGLPGNIQAGGQGGLLEVVLHPNFARNRWIYLSYAGRGSGGVGTEVVRARFQEDRLTQVETIFRALPKSQSGRHFGSRIVLSTDGYLYITLGDRADPNSAQKLDDHRGSLIRLWPDGRVPDANPFVSASGAKPEIFTYGNRNVQGIAIQPHSGFIWMHEHGPRGGDELNIAQEGANYGWPLVSHGINYDGSIISERPTRPDVEPPIYTWVPSIAPSGMTFYNSDAFPNWRDNLFVGALRARLLVRLELKGRTIIHEERLLPGEIGRIRDVRQGPEGFIYLLNDSSAGGVFRLEPVN